MSDFNSVTLTGTVTRDADLRAGKDDSLFGSINFLNEEKFTKRDGTEGLSKTYVDLKVNGQIAQKCKDLKQGDRLLVHGKVKTDSWDDKENPGKRIYKQVIQIDQVTPLGDAELPDGDDANMPAETVGAGKVKQEEMPW